jgi:hypothetical protein
MYLLNYPIIIKLYHISLPRVLKGKSYYMLGLATRSLPCFTGMHNLFYLNGVKVISSQSPLGQSRL